MCIGLKKNTEIKFFLILFVVEVWGPVYCYSDAVLRGGDVNYLMEVIDKIVDN